MMNKAISVLSGGLDSVVATSFIAQEYDVHALTFDYGQKSFKMEIKAAEAICDELAIEHDIIKLDFLANLGKSALTSSRDVPKFDEEELDVNPEKSYKVWVPGRNIVFTAIASSYAEAEDASKIVVGWDLEEANNFPDNSKEFLNAFNDLLKIGTYSDLEILAPLADLNKKEIVELGNKLNIAMDLSFSCYEGFEYHCGLCESCQRRKRAFREANIEDKTVYLE